MLVDLNSSWWCSLLLAFNGVTITTTEWYDLIEVVGLVTVVNDASFILLELSLGLPRREQDSCWLVKDHLETACFLSATRSDLNDVDG